MVLDNAIVLITGARRGIGHALALEALRRGAAKVYAGVRDLSQAVPPGTVPVRIDVLDRVSVAAAAAACADATVVINNAGIAPAGGFLAAEGEAQARAALETNFFGPLRVSQAFAPQLARHGGGAIVNILSVASWINPPPLATYGASKSAAWALTNGLRNELRAAGTQVLGVHVGFVDTDLSRDFDLPKVAAGDVARATFDALAAGQAEVLVDDVARHVQANLSAQPPVYVLPPPGG